MGKKSKTSKKKDRVKQTIAEQERPHADPKADYVIDERRDRDIIRWVSLTSDDASHAYYFYRLHRLLWLAWLDVCQDVFEASDSFDLVSAAVTLEQLRELINVSDRQETANTIVQRAIARAQACQRYIHRAINDFPELLGGDQELDEFDEDLDVVAEITRVVAPSLVIMGDTGVANEH